ncbi:MAG: hypothetical protein FWG65_03110 [Turicibacter sp.]|nr:hypothetical protein [Turicibacter sp.]
MNINLIDVDPYFMANISELLEIMDLNLMTLLAILVPLMLIQTVLLVTAVISILRKKPCPDRRKGSVALHCIFYQHDWADTVFRYRATTVGEIF